MNPRYLGIVALIFTTILIAALFAVFTNRHNPTTMIAPPRDVLKTNPLQAKPNMVDRLDFYDTPATLDRAAMEHVTLLPTTRPAHITLTDQRPKSFPRSGTWTSDEIETAFEFTELIPSWNAAVPRETGVFFQVKTRNAKDGAWSPWLYIGQWGRTPATDPADRVMSFEHGIVNVDNLTLDQPANAYQIRATLLSFDLDHDVNPSVRRIAVSYSGVVNDAEERNKLVKDFKIDGDWARSLPVPYRARHRSKTARRTDLLTHEHVDGDAILRHRSADTGERAGDL